MLLVQTLSSLEWTRLGLSLALLIVSLGLHEAAHAWAALRCGDPTGRDLGRISLNPIVHVDPMMTVVLPAVLYLTSGGRMIFGGAKPVPVNFHALRHPYRDMALVAFAGPFTNFLLVIVFALLHRVLVDRLGVWPRSALGSQVLDGAVDFNLLLAVFNLVPIPPLDGSRIMTWLLPQGLREPYQGLERIGLFLVVALVLFVPSFQIALLHAMDAVRHAVDSGFALVGL